MVSALAMTDPTTWPISGLKYGPVQVSGDSTTPSTDIISPATIFRIASPSSAPGGQPLRPLSLVLRTGNPGMDTGRENSLASFACRVAARSQPARGAPATGHRATPRVGPVSGKGPPPARQHHGHRAPDVT